MEKLKHKEHDFSSKLRQHSVIERLKQYITWRRNIETFDADHALSKIGPISINLDLTSACNFACPHCVDSNIINTGESLKLEEIKRSLDTLKARGLLSVILLGGGEPTLHKDFGEIVNYIKSMGLQLGIVTNGSKLGRIERIAHTLEKHDWVRLSLDAASQETFTKLHRPKKDLTLHEILRRSRELKLQNPDILLGYSFIIMWEGLTFKDHPICPNIHEMPEAVELAIRYRFDYISFKPCLVRLQKTQRESLLDSVERKKEQRIIKDIQINFQRANKVAENKIKLLASVNLRAIMDNKVDELKRQPNICHMQFFNTVVTPSGIFNCPAFRGVENAKIAKFDGYFDSEKFDETSKSLIYSITTFNAKKECEVIACFYNHVNWWVENFIHSDKSVDEIEVVENDNFFL